MTKDGGPAFPGVNYVPSDDGIFSLNGMTLRDYFAAKAMQGLLANPNVRPEVDCATFYSWADSMLQERAK